MTGRAARAYAADPIVAIPGPLPQAWQVMLVRTVVDENVGLPDAATLTFRDPYHQLLVDTGITIGKPLQVSVALSDGSAQELLFSGEVTALELDTDGTGSFTIVRALSKVHRLTRGKRVKAFRNATAQTIVAEVAKGAGLGVGRVQAERVVYTQRTQGGVSDWDFLADLAREHGAVVRADRQGNIEFVRPKQATAAPAPTTRAAQNRFVLEYGRNLLALRAVLTASDQANSVRVRGWNVDTKLKVLAYETTGTSKTVKPGMSGAKVANAFGKATALVTDIPHGNQAEARTTARSRAESVSTGVGEIEAVAEGDPQLRAGIPIALGNVGPDFSGKYTTTAVHHTLEPEQGYRTTVMVSATPDRSLAALTSSAPHIDRGPRIPGVVSGIVTDVKELGGRQRGWVKLSFPWLDDTYETDWVRTVQWGGQGGGGVFSPEVDDEVLVAFEQGCLDKPYVIGGLYNGRDVPSPHSMPLVDRSGRVNRRSVVSRKGHRLELIDGLTGPPGVRIASGNDRLEIRMNETASTIDVTVHGPGGRGSLASIQLTPRGITLDAGSGELALFGGAVSINGQRSVDIDGGLTASLAGRVVRIN
ncbi:VgrG-related protein [Actinokineospora enzanensis]|uniref:VgrG-related protein n=1 Tax=Actinokineospora enzanensis TaxID=155975 RepID=UPI00037231C1|nr:VgrG-related protein [Actinokineospora enzanensis]